MIEYLFQKNGKQEYQLEKRDDAFKITFFGEGKKNTWTHGDNRENTHTTNDRDTIKRKKWTTINHKQKNISYLMDLSFQQKKREGVGGYFCTFLPLGSLKCASIQPRECFLMNAINWKMFFTPWMSIIMHVECYGVVGGIYA